MQATSLPVLTCADLSGDIKHTPAVWVQVATYVSYCAGVVAEDATATPHEAASISAVQTAAVQTPTVQTPAVYTSAVLHPPLQSSSTQAALAAVAVEGQRPQTPHRDSRKATGDKRFPRKANTRQQQHTAAKQHNRQQDSHEGVQDEFEEEVTAPLVRQHQIASISSSATEQTSSMVAEPDAPMTSLRQQHLQTAIPCAAQAWLTAS